MIQPIVINLNLNPLLLKSFASSIEASIQLVMACLTLCSIVVAILIPYLQRYIKKTDKKKNIIDNLAAELYINAISTLNKDFQETTFFTEQYESFRSNATLFKSNRLIDELFLIYEYIYLHKYFLEKKLDRAYFLLELKFRILIRYIQYFKLEKNNELDQLIKILSYYIGDCEWNKCVKYTWNDFNNPLYNEKGKHIFCRDESRIKEILKIMNEYKNIGTKDRDPGKQKIIKIFIRFIIKEYSEIRVHNTRDKHRKYIEKILNE
ncbi:hypothetical protein GF362_04710 [Candidatus Dojkabacteria bacterium]|nr:hypothetical protein [Candidatus Dojkabacteria bacterium]